MRQKVFGGILLVLVGTAMVAGVVFYVLNVGKAQDARSQWPTVQGTILASRLQCIASMENTVQDDDWNLVVEFAYEVQGTHYADKQKWFVVKGCFPERSGPTRQAEREKLKYSPGTIVPIYYNPQNHKKAVVEPRGDDLASADWAFLVILIGVLLVCGGIAVLRWTAVTRPKQG